MEQRGDHAVVLGASMGGLLAARVLSEFFDRVTVVERDVLPTDPVNRRGVPQGRLIHACLARLAQVLDELFPGFSDELITRGVSRWDDGDFAKLDWSFGGHRLVREGRSADVPRLLSPSRPVLEYAVRQRVRSIPNISFCEGRDVVGLTATPDRCRITGVRVVDRADDSAEELTAELVVDATGRGSRTPVFLEELGYDRPREDEVVVQLAYACQLLRIPAGVIKEHMIARFPAPGRPKMFALIDYGDNTYMVGAGTMAGVAPPRDHAEILDYAAELAPVQVAEAIRTAQPISDVVHHRVPSNRWRRYDKLRRLPQGLLVVGDAVCSFNPIYGQGMTVAALEAVVLRQCLRRGKSDLSRRFARMAAKNVRVAWQTAVASDLTLPEVQGHRPTSMRISNACLEPVMTASETDPVVAGQFLRIVGMLDSPATLLRPSILLRILRAQHRRTGGRSVHEGSDGRLAAVAR
ncbi:FAD-dependent oxidoreductase [Mycobacterium asiaticum]|uniref:2-polyprenyl-6-methoxyphenol hydroxylase-like oxidoreductase n=1 Tax=Mycobacterium asiaticum TaxID=1790 RepID=A0A1A3CH77_MYCAS|nr:FAD-dependent monooxygenase [Mycobacterium asiaticum]OBI86305.1 2-polyprenyl-6-methoxyphenol hydroxylase-like oxidoreductase [Mycobacterium asiaticum]